MKLIVNSEEVKIPTYNGLKQGDTLFSLLLNFDLEYDIRKAAVNQEGLKLNGTHQLLVYSDDVNLLGKNINPIKKNRTISQQKSVDFVTGITSDLTSITTILHGC
jgi:hypothetical protein